MSYQVPNDYVSLPSSKLSIPHALIGDDLKTFSGARSTVRYVQAASGQNVGPGSSILFNLPAEPYGYIKPNSLMLRGVCTVSFSAGAGAQDGVANAYSTNWQFAGTPNPVIGQLNATIGSQPYTHFQKIMSGSYDSAASTLSSLASTQSEFSDTNNNITTATLNQFASKTAHYVGGATSLLNRISVTLPGGSSFTYNQHHHWRNAVAPHTLSKAYIESDLRHLEGSFVHINAGGNTSNIQAFTVPLDIPVFNADAAFPMLLVNGGISIELTSNSVAEAFTSTGGSYLSGYTLSKLALVYEVITVTPDFKNALIAAKGGGTYNIHVNDRMSLGPVGQQGGGRVNVGVSLSSVKCVLFTMMPQSQLAGPSDTVGKACLNAAAGGALTGVAYLPLEKFYGMSGCSAYNVYRDGMQITPNYMDSDDMWYSEMQRAVGRINDSNTSSALYTTKASGGSNERTNYARAVCLWGATMSTLDDWSYASQGVPVDQLSIETIFSTITKDNIGATSTVWSMGATQGQTANNLYIWACFDSIVMINPDGTCSIRR